MWVWENFIMETVYVIGSGPAGVAAALGLLERQNVHVVMLDVGKLLESNKLEKRLNAYRLFLT